MGGGHAIQRPAAMVASSLRNFAGFRDRKNWRIGIAVSGGVDSMALALACRQVGSESQSKIIFNALIVDHKSQAGSTESAKRTKQRLMKIGIHSKILTLKWKHPDPAKLSNFEEEARILRYRALVNACAEYGFDVLMTAHHNSDQIESLLMGLKDRESGLFVRAMKTRSPIPESSGVYGVDCSGIINRSIKTLSKTAALLSDYSEQVRWFEEHRWWTRAVEYGETCLLRPFLHISKQELISACRAAVIEWEEDSTNADVTVTTRNAVRSLLRSNRLPVALREESLYRLNLKVRKRMRLASNLFHFVERCCEILLFDIRSGTLKVRFVQGFFQTMKEQLGDDMLKYIAAGVLETFLDPVSCEKIKYESLRAPAIACFPELGAIIEDPDCDLDQPSALTSCGVLLRRSHVPQPPPSDSEEEELFPLDRDYVWTLSREPSTSIPSMKFLIEERFGKWRLWDNRYWIQVKGRTPSQIYMRSLRVTDFAHISRVLTETQYKDFRAHLTAIAPGNIRYTLPILVKNLGNVEPGIIAMPSLGKKGDFLMCQRMNPENIEWKIRYKHFSLRANGLGNKFDEQAQGHVSLKYDDQAFKNWLNDDYLEGTDPPREPTVDASREPTPDQRPKLAERQIIPSLSITKRQRDRNRGSRIRVGATAHKARYHKVKTVPKIAPTSDYAGKAEKDKRKPARPILASDASVDVSQDNRPANTNHPMREQNSGKGSTPRASLPSRKYKSGGLFRKIPFGDFESTHPPTKNEEALHFFDASRVAMPKESRKKGKGGSSHSARDVVKETSAYPTSREISSDQMAQERQKAPSKVKKQSKRKLTFWKYDI